MKGKNKYVINKGKEKEVVINYKYELDVDEINQEYHFKITLLNYTKETIFIYADEYSYVIKSKKIPEVFKHQTFKMEIKRFLMKLIDQRNNSEIV